TLDLKYEIIINGIAGSAKLLEAIEWTVTVGGVTTALEDLKGVLVAGEKSDAIVLTGHMKEEAGNEYQGLAASGISISVFATQLTSESDSFDNNYDDEAHLEYVYDDTKTAKENAADLQALIDTAVEGATIVVSAGTYDVSGISGSQIKLTKDNITLLGKNGVIINDEGESGTNVQAVIKITGDNVTVSNIYAEDKGENTVILAFGNNVTIANCTLKGYASSAWGQYLEAGVMIVANDVVNAPITKYTVTNNTFIDCNVSLQNGVGNGGNAEDLIISGNTFKNAGVFIEHNQTNSVTGAVEPWHVTDILVLPTIKNNVFESPSVWLGSTPFAMYLRVYRDNDVETMTPASYWTDFVANNTIMDYNGEKLSTDSKAALFGENGVQMRPNGKVQYYGLNFIPTVSTADELKTALTNGNNVVFAADITVDKWIMFSETKTIGNGNIITVPMNGLTIDGNGHTLTVNSIESAGNGNLLFDDASNLNIYNLTIKKNCGGGAIGLKSGIINNVNFIGGGYAIHPGAGEVTVENCTFATADGDALYFEQERDNLTVTGCTFNQLDDENVILLRGDVKFTNNTVNSGRTVNIVSGSPVVTGNNFNDVRLKVYSAATATVSGNTINNLVFETATYSSTFTDNTLSTAAQAALAAATKN
ncbi:MAG: right-handed parallel beta-helix repeat-containing protein, partial [Clostridia bacterium]|nr:right-handed parallel beta-helix repeat-containing protein [Clostridia bacterium]